MKQVKAKLSLERFVKLLREFQKVESTWTAEKLLKKILITGLEKTEEEISENL